MTDTTRSTDSRAVRMLLRVAAALAVLTATLTPATAVPPAQALPERLSNADFWKLVSEISEPGGFFRISDNYTSNEREVGYLFTMIRERGPQGGVYLGVGPEQNFTYIAALRPAMAFIVDIRRQAVMQHLMFKAIFELSDDRADFLSLLFSKPRPPGIERTTPIQQIWELFWPVESTSDAWPKNYGRIVTHLTRTHGFSFTAEESAQLRAVFDAFYWYGPQISTRGAAGGFGGSGVTFADLTGYAYDARGQPQSFLSSDEHYRFVKSMHERNVIVPVSGDFGGSTAIRAIGAYLRERGGIVTAFYVSNVEQYLFQDGKDRAFFDNVAMLPLGETSVFIRPYAFRRGGPAQALCPIAPFLRSVQAGRVYSNNQALACME